MTQELYSILEQLQEYKRDKNILLEFYIETRLNKSLETYYKELTDTLRYLTRVNEKKVLKNLGKE